MYNKYHAKKTWMKGRVYDSKKEANRAFELELLAKYGKIQNLQKQVPFVLQEGFVDRDGHKVRPIEYVCDFVYEENGQKIAEDSKGFRTKEFILKKKMFLYRYREYKFIES